MESRWTVQQRICEGKCGLARDAPFSFNRPNCGKGVFNELFVHFFDWIRPPFSSLPNKRTSKEGMYGFPFR